MIKVIIINLIMIMIGINLYIKNLDNKEVWIIILMLFLVKEINIFQNQFKIIKGQMNHNYINLDILVEI